MLKESFKQHFKGYLIDCMPANVLRKNFLAQNRFKTARPIKTLRSVRMPNGTIVKTVTTNRPGVVRTYSIPPVQSRNNLRSIKPRTNIDAVNPLGKSRNELIAAHRKRLLELKKMPKPRLFQINPNFKNKTSGFLEILIKSQEKTAFYS